MDNDGTAQNSGSVVNQPSSGKAHDKYFNAVDSPLNQPTRQTALSFDQKYQLPLTRINNTYVDPLSRAYTAIVSLSGGRGTFKDLQSAITYVNSQGGGEIFIKSGQYSLSGTIKLFSNITITGQDNNLSILDFQNGTASYLSAVGTTNAHLRNIHFQNLYIKNSGVSDIGAITINYVDDFTVEHCKFNNNFNSNAGNGGDINIVNSSNCVVENCVSGTSGALVTVQSSNVVTIRNNYSQASLSYGAALTDGTAMIVSENSIQNPSNNGFYLDGTSVTVCDNHIFDGTTTGIYVTNLAQYIDISNNIINNTGTNIYGIQLATNAPNNNEICNNLILGSAKIGIGLDVGNRNIIQGNRIVQCTTGISIGTACDRNIIIGNQLTGCGTPLTNNGTNGTAVGNITT